VEKDCLIGGYMKKRFTLFEIISVTAMTIIITLVVVNNSNNSNNQITNEYSDKYDAIYIDNDYSNDDIYETILDLLDDMNSLKSDYASNNVTLKDIYERVSHYTTAINPNNVFLKMYPVGSIYISVSNTNPGTLFGGTWVSFGSGKSLVGVNSSDTDFDTVEETGGAASISYTPSGTVDSHTLTVAEIPSHTHTFTGTSHSHKPSNTGTNFIILLSGENPAISTNAYAWWTNSGTADKYFIYVSATSFNNNSSGAVYEPVNTSYTTAGGTNANTGGGSGHTHPFTGTAATIDIQDPYITVYMWKRTA